LQRPPGLPGATLHDLAAPAWPPRSHLARPCSARLASPEPPCTTLQRPPGLPGATLHDLAMPAWPAQVAIARRCTPPPPRGVLPSRHVPGTARQFAVAHPARRCSSMHCSAAGKRGVASPGRTSTARAPARAAPAPISADARAGARGATASAACAAARSARR
jgi:hypothetical protein